MCVCGVESARRESEGEGELLHMWMGGLTAQVRD